MHIFEIGRNFISKKKQTSICKRLKPLAIIPYGKFIIKGNVNDTVGRIHEFNKAILAILVIKSIFSCKIPPVRLGGFKLFATIKYLFRQCPTETFCSPCMILELSKPPIPNTNSNKLTAVTLSMA